MALAGGKASYAAMFKAVRTGRVSKAQWRQRMRVCMKCPIYDPMRKLCRREIQPYGISAYSVEKFLEPAPPPPNQVLGCGCYTPYLALVRAPYAAPDLQAREAALYGFPHRRGCWGRAHVGGDFGWGEV